MENKFNEKSKETSNLLDLVRLLLIGLSIMIAGGLIFLACYGAAIFTFNIFE